MKTVSSHIVKFGYIGKKKFEGKLAGLSHGENLSRFEGEFSDVGKMLAAILGLLCPGPHKSVILKTLFKAKKCRKMGSFPFIIEIKNTCCFDSIQHLFFFFVLNVH